MAEKNDKNDKLVEGKIIWSQDWAPKSVKLSDLLAPDGKGGHKWVTDAVKIVPPNTPQDKREGE